jgi:hypothetical protein
VFDGIPSFPTVVHVDTSNGNVVVSGQVGQIQEGADVAYEYVTEYATVNEWVTENVVGTTVQVQETKTIGIDGVATVVVGAPQA